MDQQGPPHQDRTTYNLDQHQQNPIQKYIVPTFLTIYKPSITDKSKTYILPLNANFSMDWGLQGQANCTFCNRHPETDTHIFSDCSYTNIIWAALGRITGWEITDSEINLNFPTQCENKIVKVILVSITTHAIWKERNNSKHNPNSRITNQIGLVRKIWAKLKGRLHYELRRHDDNLKMLLRELVGKFDSFFSTAGRALPD